MNRNIAANQDAVGLLVGDEPKTGITVDELIAVASLDQVEERLVAVVGDYFLAAAPEAMLKMSDIDTVIQGKAVATVREVIARVKAEEAYNDTLERENTPPVSADS